MTETLTMSDIALDAIQRYPDADNPSSFLAVNAGNSYLHLPDVPGVAVIPERAQGRKCARSWKILPSVGDDPQFPDVTPRDAQALREWEAMRKAAE